MSLDQESVLLNKALARALEQKLLNTHLALKKSQEHLSAWDQYVPEMLRVKSQSELLEFFVTLFSKKVQNQPVIYFSLDNSKKCLRLSATCPKDLFSGVLPSFALTDTDFQNLESSKPFLRFLKDCLNLNPDHIPLSDDHAFKNIKLIPFEAFGTTQGLFVMSCDSTKSETLEKLISLWKMLCPLATKHFENLEIPFQAARAIDVPLVPNESFGLNFYPESLFLDQVHFEVSLALRYEHALSICTIRLNNLDPSFQEINQKLQRHFRNSDFYTKTAEGVYIVALRNCNMARALTRTQAFLDAIKSTHPDFLASACVAEYPSTHSSAAALIADCHNTSHVGKNLSMTCLRPQKGYLSPYTPIHRPSYRIPSANQQPSV